MEVMKIEPYLEQRRCSGGGGPIPCPQCGKMFAKEFDIKRHMFTHTGEKPFKVSLWSPTVILFKGFGFSIMLGQNRG